MNRLTNSGGWLVRSRNERNINFIKPTIILVRARGSNDSGFDYGIEEEIEMNKKITIYELLGMVKDGKAPRKVKGRLGKIYTYHNYCKDYIDDEGKLLFAHLCQLIDKCLNDYVEILDDEDMEIEELHIINGAVDGKWENGSSYNYTLSAPQTVIIKKVNELVREINKLKKEGK